MAQQRPNSQRTTRPDIGKAASAKVPVFKRFRVTTDQGVLVVYDAEETQRAANFSSRGLSEGEDAPTQLAYWNDFGSEQLYFFDRRLLTLPDVAESIAALQRDLEIDIDPILNEKPELIGGMVGGPR